MTRLAAKLPQGFHHMVLHFTALLCVPSLFASCHSASHHFTQACLHATFTCLQVGQKRGRSQLEEMNAEALDGAKRKKIRLGFPASQWVTVYNKHAPMKQR
jgi:hypothetical protein